ncbi:MAG: PAS domain S-box protein [Armatimonadota bacterium]|nr:PAS domain S-box protein [Armatimonadota bacterium]
MEGLRRPQGDSLWRRTVRRLALSRVRISLLALMLLAGLPGLGLAFSMGLESRRATAAATHAEAAQLVRLLSLQQRQLIDQTRVLLVDLARHPEIARRQHAACSALLLETLRRYPRYANLGAADPAGNVFCSALPLTPPVNIADRAYFRLAVERRDFALGEYQVGRITGKASVNAGYPVLDRAGQVTAVVFAALGLDWLNTLAAESRLPPGAVLHVVDAQGTILARYPDPQPWVGKAFPDAPSIRAVLAAGGEGTAEVSGVDGVRRLYAFAPLTPSPQPRGPFVSIGIPTAVAYAGATRLLVRNLLGLLLAGAVMLAATWWVGDLLVVRRVRALVQAAQRLGSGDLAARTELPHTAGELGLLARAFDEMAGALEQRQAETRAAVQALRASEERLRLLVEQLPAVVWTTDRELRFTASQGAGLARLGLRPNQVVGQSLREYFRTDDPDYLPIAAHRAALAGESVAYELEWEGRAYVSHVEPLRDGTGQTIGVLGIALDVTERRHAEEALRSLNVQLERRVRERTAELREAKAFLEHLIATSPGILFQAARDYTLTYISPNLERILGYRPEEVVGVPYSFLEKIHPEDRDQVQVADEQRPRGGRPSPGREVGLVREVRLRHRDGTYRWFSVAMRISHDADGTPATILGHALDVTERKRAEEALLEARAEAERANLAKSDFLSRMSHELRTPLHAILGFAQLLEMEPLRPEQEESVRQILRAGHHLLELISEVLDIARIEAGRVAISLEPVQVGGLIREVLDLMAPVAADRRIRVRGEAAASPAYVRADRQRLRQVLLNLLSNAVKYNRPAGTVEVTLHTASPHRLRFLVSDTGPGIPPEWQQRLFQPFERLHADQTGVEGAGLGLALSKRLVEAMGGQIGVESTPGAGSTFWVELPAVPDPLEGHRLAASASPGGFPDAVFLSAPPGGELVD